MKEFSFDAGIVEVGKLRFFLSLSLCLDLGIVNAAVLRTVTTQGGTAGFLLGAGSCCGDLIYLTCALLGAAAFLQWTPIRLALWLVGTCALLLLSWRMIHEVVRPKNPYTTKLPPAQSRLFATGIGLAWASPSAILWFVAIGGSIAASFGGERKALLGFTAGFFTAGVSAVMFLYFAIVIFLQGLHQFAPMARALVPVAPGFIPVPGVEQACV